MEQARGVRARLSTFIGRKKEMAELRRLAAHTRILTVLGPGGAGKTRLATEFARQQQSRFADGSVLVELAEVRDPALVADAIARAARITVPGGAEALSELSRRLVDKQMLLVVDNCEHLVAAAAGTVAQLLQDAEGITVVATSRERLNVDGETTYRLPSMALPQTADAVDAAAATDAVRLFVDRARSARPGFELEDLNLASVVAICRRLDGMPLAIELAAARVATLSPAEIMVRLDDRLKLLTGGSRDVDQRHQTLRATLDWSYELLEPDERTLLQRLSVFAGAFRLDAVEEICGFAPLEPAGIVDGVQRLADKSMLQAEAAADGIVRYRLLETIRAYAAGNLGQTDDAELRDRHLARYRRMAQRAFEARLVRGALPEHRRLWEEIADIRMALTWAEPEPLIVLDLLGCLRSLWMIFGPGEGLKRLRPILTELPRESTRVQVRALWCYQALSGRAGVLDQNLVTPDELGQLALEAGEVAVVPMRYLGAAYQAERLEGDHDKAYELLLRAIEGLEATGNLPDMAMALGSVGAVEMQRGNLEAARPWIQRAIQVATEAEDTHNELGAWYILGWLEILAGNVDAARRSFLTAIELADPTDLLSIALQIEGIAATSAEAGRALALFAAASRMRQETGSPVAPPWSRWIEPAIATARQGLPGGTADAAWTAGLALRAGDAVIAARAITSGQGGREKGRKGLGGLSRRELEVARLVATGSSNREIAQRLFLSERTVESHVDHIMGKLNFNSRTQISGWVAEQRLAHDEGS